MDETEAGAGSSAGVTSRPPPADGRCPAVHPSGSRCILPAGHAGDHQLPEAAGPLFQWQPGQAAPGVGGAPGLGGVATRFCHACGSQIDARAEICPRCGVRQLAAGGGKDRVAAAALALVLGGFGVHKFYLGRVGQGLVYLVFFWTYIPTLVAWVEAILYLRTSNEAWADKYGGPVQSPNSLAIGCLWAVALLPLLALVGVFVLIVMGAGAADILRGMGRSI